MNNTEIQYWANKFEHELLKAINDHNPEFKPFLAYFGSIFELAKAGKIKAPIHVNTAGAYRHWFSETHLPEYPEVENAFYKLVYYLKDGDNDPSEQEIKQIKIF